MADVLRSVVIHGHFYQPPREDPWSDRVPRQPSAAPFHDWNERIEHECYRAVVAARIPAPDGRIARIINTLDHISFDFGPTLLEWLEREAPGTYQAILAADGRSARRLSGHGNALAMPFHHSILPLASRREKTSEVRWGIEDFRRRFRREPLGMWLPETAVDDETLDVLAKEGIHFTILAPHQVDQAPQGGGPVMYRTGGGRTLALFVYEGGISHDVAFGTLLKDASVWVGRMLAMTERKDGDTLASVATDGETYGHHHPFGEMALAALLDGLARRPGVRVENFSSFLARNPPTEDARLVECSSWSCSHGVERWRSDCGCRMSSTTSTQQEWRRPLREAMEWLNDELSGVFAQEGAALFVDPWGARDAYGSVVGGSEEDLEGFLSRWCRHHLTDPEAVRARELLELARNSLRLFTSCGWFFDDVAGIEARQILRYAARALDLAGDESGALERELLRRLEGAVSNDPKEGNAADVYLRHAKPSRAPHVVAAAGVGVLAQLEPAVGSWEMGAYRGQVRHGHVSLVHAPTGRGWEHRVSVRGRSSDLTVEVETESECYDLTARDLPEPAREKLLRSLRSSLVEAWLTPAERAALSLGEAALPQAVLGALERSLLALSEGVRGQEDAGIDLRVRRVMDLLDLLELLDETVPFAAQTAFWAIWKDDRHKSDPTLRAIAYRLGFHVESRSESGEEEKAP